MSKGIELPDDKSSLKALVIRQQEEIQFKSQEIQSKSQEIQSKEEEISSQRKTIESYREEISSLNDLLRLLRRQRFAPRSEKVSSLQLGIFNEAEMDAGLYPSEGEDDKGKTAVTGYKRGRPKRKPLPDFLPREEIIIELPEQDRICAHDGNVMTEIGREVSEQLDIIPAQIKVLRFIRIKYGCKKCEEGVLTAPVPPKTIPKSIASAGLLAFIAISKYTDGLPLYRIENILRRCRVDISRGTMANWMVRIAELLTPLINLLEETLLESSYISCDETTVQVLKEEGKKPTTQSYMWVRARAGPTDRPIILFEYDPTRSGNVPVRLLQGFEGHLQVDAYDGYNKVCSNPKVVRIGCWSHVRRKFFEAFKSLKKSKGKNQKGRSQRCLKFIKKLYKIETKIKHLSVEDRTKVRQEEAEPILAEIRTWLDDHLHTVVPKSLLGKAVHYAHNEWPHLVCYIEDGRLNIDNNFVENAIRPFAVGRKNWLFSDTVGGVTASATLYSLLETAKANGHEPYSYFRYVLTEIPKAKTLEDFDALLPYNLKPINIFPGGVP